MPQNRKIWPPKPNVGDDKASESPPRDNQIPPKTTSLIHASLRRGGASVRKTGPRSNKIKQMQKQNTEDTQYKRDTDLRGSPSVGYVHQRNCQVLPLLLSSKMKG
jgi:hypothetical protein